MANSAELDKLLDFIAEQAPLCRAITCNCKNCLLFRLRAAYHLGAAAVRAEERQRCAKKVESFIRTPHTACRNALTVDTNYGSGHMIGHQDDCLYSIAAAIQEGSEHGK